MVLSPVLTPLRYRASPALLPQPTRPSSSEHLNGGLNNAMNQN
jgi:hypothetical protein